MCCGEYKAKKIMRLFPEMCVTKKIFTRATEKIFFINLIEFFNKNLQSKNYSNSTFLSWKTKSPIFYFLKGKKRKFVRISLLTEIFLFVCVGFLKQKIYILIHIRLMRASTWWKDFHPAVFLKQDYFFLA